MKCCNELKKLLQCADGSVEHSTVAAKQGKTFQIDSTQHFCRIELDQAAIPCLVGHGKKVSDFIFVCCNKKQHDSFYESYFFVELKGLDVGAAIKQIESTIQNFRQEHKAPLDRIFGYIVSPGLRDIANQKFRNEKERLRKKGISVERGTDKYTRRYP